MDDGEEEEEEEEDLEEEEEEEVDHEATRPKKRIGRPPKAWSSVLLPKEVTSTLGAHKQKGMKSQKVNTSTKNRIPSEGEGTFSKVPLPSMVGQAVHGIVDGCFDAGYLVSLRMDSSDILYRGVVFGPGLSIPVSKDTDIAKNVKRKRRKRNPFDTDVITREEPSTPPPPQPAPRREEGSALALHSNSSITRPPLHYEVHPSTQHIQQPNSAHLLESSQVSPPVHPSSHPHQFAYNGGMPVSFRSPRPHPEMNVNPYMHSGSFPPRPGMPMPAAAQVYSPRQNFGQVLRSPSTPYGYNFAGSQGRATAPLPPQYRGPPADPQYPGS
ncbi:hypothetical protein KP509_01G076300 [Ceratopteris richardii]|uniref:Uncharacterized protein n=1 Tax=Ceratopteris richardii TaxID=49495 RepID=A0A8T2VMJ5_CERRI|nr:hypothetical protein KP509_01G076300 [Ceratopteris richardii]KAH7446794.1 hypothetical protein KP509_01G076300 [Ceratopteris richardii]KAH7446795.1 hypothetical protein KP509_01G076300 [Ceratopteris richardii]